MANREIRLAVPPETLQVYPGDTIQVVCEFDYVGPEVPSTQGAKVHVAMYSWTAVDPHNEKAFVDVPLVLPNSPAPGQHVKVNAPIKLPTTGLPDGLLYGLFFAIKGVLGKDWYSDYYGKESPLNTWIISVISVAQISNLKISSYSRLA